MDKLEMHLAFHGFIILLSGLLGGVPFARAIIKKDNEVAWRVVHSGGCMGGIMVLAIGAFINKFNISALFATFLASGIIISTYAFVIAMITAAISKERGLDSRKTAFIPKTIYVLYGIGTVMSIISVAGLIYAAFKSLL